MSLSRFFSTPATRELLYPTSRMFRMFDDPFFSAPLSQQLASSPFASTLSSTKTPSFDVKETESEYVLEGEVPGVDKKNINLEFVDPQTLSVKGYVEQSKEYSSSPMEEPENPVDSTADSQTSETAVTAKPEGAVSSVSEKASGTYWASERIYGSFSRAFRFPTPVDSENVAASLKNGILHVKVPKIKETPVKKIEIASE
ncbi:HSP20-like chaperone [Lipomyces oligophaga]|uniref:HSP20-like chaperone n=1 Tax=Lipomyces oligophaga TaxID=45792 RepID=UPI0034CE4163